ncbi:MAG TPA: alpha-ketoglutarate-dependent dioxygenase AlkB [Actinomycetota bacterium]|nr:alpha-ketoglutarate-dependent dioxygenase AlkB [Actinomycetota bacterium]
MQTALNFPWQPSLFALDEEPDIDHSFSSARRVQLDADSWVDHVPGWVKGAERLFEELLAGMTWQQRSRHMYDKRVLEPRLTAHWNTESGSPLEPPVLEDMRKALSARYEREFDSAGFNLYRDGRDSVAWHADRIAKEIEDPIVALISLGEPRKFLLRPKGGGASKSFLPAAGDLLVTGGKTQRTWEHSVPKVAKAGPRISIAFRHGMDPSVYARKRIEAPSPDA